MNNEDEIYKVKAQARKRIKHLNLIIKKFDLENKNLNRKLKINSESYQSSISRNAELRQQVFNFKRNEIKFNRKLTEFENNLSMIKSYFNLDNIEEITSYIQRNIIEKKSDLEIKEKELELKQLNIDIKPEIELPKFLNLNRKKS